MSSRLCECHVDGKKRNTIPLQMTDELESQTAQGYYE